MERLRKCSRKIQILYVILTPIFFIGLKFAEILPASIYIILFFVGWFLYCLLTIAFGISILVRLAMGYVYRAKQYGIKRVVIEVSVIFVFTILISLGVTLWRDGSLTYYNSFGLVTLITIVYCSISFGCDRKESN